MKKTVMLLSAMLLILCLCGSAGAEGEYRNIRITVNGEKIILLDENEAPVAMGLCFPSIAEALVGTGGHLTPLTLIRLLKAINHPKIIDLGLIGVDPSWANRGVSVVICAMLNHMMLDKKLEYAETNLNLEDNYAINNQWKRFDRFIHKRRRSYLKQL